MKSFELQRYAYLVFSTLLITVMVLVLFSDLFAQRVQAGPEILQIEFFREMRSILQASTRLYVFSYYYALTVLIISQMFACLLLLKPIKDAALFRFAEAIFFANIFGIGFMLCNIGLGDGTVIIDIIAVTAFISFGISYYSFMQAFSQFPLVRDIVGSKGIYSLTKAIKKNPSVGLLFRKDTLYGRFRRANQAWELNLRRKLRWKTSMLSLFFTNKELISILLVISMIVVWYKVPPNIVVGGLATMFVYFSTIYGFTWCLVKIHYDYILGDQTIKKQVMWVRMGLSSIDILSVLFACVIFATIVVSLQLHYNLVLWIFFIWPPTAFLIVVVCIIVSIFFYGAIDPKLALTKSTLYSLLAITLTTIFVALEGVLASSAILQIGMSSEASTIISGAITALAFAPVRKRLEGFVKRSIDKALPASALGESRRYDAVVVFNDLSGFVKISETDEMAALTLLSLLHKEGNKAAISKNGRVVKTIGDAVLMEFESSDQALEAVTEFHKSFRESCQRMVLPLIPIHSGMHMGQVVKSFEGDIFGRTVNIAARLEGLAGEDEIVISDAVNQHLSTKRELLEEMGDQKLKNVPQPLFCYKLSCKS